MRQLVVSSICMLLSSAFLVYGLSYDAQLYAARVAAQERNTEKARSDIAVLKAERAHLARPERIEPLARAHGLMPMTPRQLAASKGAADITTGSTSR